MAVVVDANILIVLVSSEERRQKVRDRLSYWSEVGEQLHAPALLPYEVANGLARLMSAGLMTPQDLRSAWHTFERLRITYHPLHLDGDKVVSIALQLRRSSAYDAAYVALAQDLGAELWTLDGPLARNAGGLGFPVHLLE